MLSTKYHVVTCPNFRWEAACSGGPQCLGEERVSRAGAGGQAENGGSSFCPMTLPGSTVLPLVASDLGEGSGLSSPPGLVPQTTPPACPLRSRRSTAPTLPLGACSCARTPAPTAAVPPAGGPGPPLPSFLICMTGETVATPTAWCECES